MVNICYVALCCFLAKTQHTDAHNPTNAIILHVVLQSFTFHFIVSSAFTPNCYWASPSSSLHRGCNIRLCATCCAYIPHKSPKCTTLLPCLVHPGVIKVSGCIALKAKWQCPLLMVSLQPNFFVYDLRWWDGIGILQWGKWSSTLNKRHPTQLWLRPCKQDFS